MTTRIHGFWTWDLMMTFIITVTVMPLWMDRMHTCAQRIAILKLEMAETS